MLRLILLILPLFLSSCSSSDVPELHIFMWADYVKPELIQRFEREHHCHIVVDTYDTNEAMYAKLKLGVTGFDLIFPSNYVFNLMLHQKMIEQLNMTFIPNIKFLDKTYSKRLSNEELQYGIPYMLSFTGIGYRADKVQDPVTSWGVFGNKRYKGRMTMLNDMRETLGACLRYLGYSINTRSPDEIEQAADVLIAWKQNFAKFENEQYKNGIATSEFLVVQGYNGDIAQVEEENPNVRFSYPIEGTSFAIDLVAIPKGSQNRELAHTFINFLLQPDVAAENIAFTHFLSPNTGAYDLLSEGLRNNDTLFPPAQVLENAELLESVDDVIYQYISAWDRAKAA